MNKRTLKIAPAICWLAVFFAACSQDGDPGGVENSLITFHAQIGDRQTRSTAGSNSWNGGEQVQVGIDNEAAVTFTAAANGTLTPVDPLYWQSASQSISARAWYPASWTMQADQQRAENFQKADFIFATVTRITAANCADNPFVFRHQTAKVTANLTAGTGISAGDLTSATVSFYGYTSGSADTGNGSLSGSVNGWIIPLRSGNTCTALLIPQDMTGVDFICVTISSNSYYYKPAANEANLEGGKSYTYDITVKNGDAAVTSGGVALWTRTEGVAETAAVD
ncbi:MAG: fimbrillin family protein [Tannerellaceae bacterium]|nr:fimbrillin family protein [Tannerellaceae bacterium]